VTNQTAVKRKLQVSRGRQTKQTKYRVVSGLGGSATLKAKYR
jgi:hypothetical protein